MIEIEKPNITTAEMSEDGSYGVFVIEPLERGFGHTLGNPLRRVLLESLPGVAVTNIKIDGVLHEFSTIPGVTEDVTEIVLNVKGIIAKLHCQGPKTVFIDVVGEHEVTAGDIKQDYDIEILNPEHHLATVGENERFYMELTFNCDRGYVSQERNKQLHNDMMGMNSTMPINTIYTDSIYTPVYKVNSTVESTRSGSNTDLALKLTEELGTEITAKGMKQMMNRWRFALEEQGIYFESRRSNGQKFVRVKYISSSDGDSSVPSDLSSSAVITSVPLVPCVPESEVANAGCP